MKVSEHIFAADRQRIELEVRKNFLAKLPSSMELASLSFFAGHWHIGVSASLAEMLALFPPAHAKMILRDSSWSGTPENKPVDWNQRALPLVGHLSGVRWHHYLADGTHVEVEVMNAQLPILPGYVRQAARHNSVLVRKLRAIGPLLASPADIDQAAWDAFYTAEAYTRLQLMFARVFHAAAKRNVALTTEMLPVAPAATLEVGGEQLVIAHAAGTAPAETVPAGSPLSALPRIGCFWAVFTKSQAERLVAFANANRKNLEEAMYKAAHAGALLAVKSLADFQEEYLSKPIANALDDEVLTHWAQLQTGLPVSVHLRSSLPARFDGFVEVWVHLWGWNEGGTVQLPSAVYDPRGFDFQNPPFYKYEENAQSF